MRRAVVAAVAAGLALSGCGGDDDSAAGALKAATGKLGDIKSGDLALEVKVAPDTEGSTIGFELAGPFALARRPGELPRADMKYTQIAGPGRGTVGFVSDGRRAWVKVDGQAYTLPPEQVRRLRAGKVEGGGPLAQLDMASWTRDAKLADGASLEGRPTQRVSGQVEVAAALNDVLEVLEETGGRDAAGGLGKLEGKDAEQVDKAVRSAPIDVVIGKDDRLLRRLSVTVDFEVKPRELPGGLGRLSGAKVTFDLRIADPNGPVTIDAPSGALPYEQLPRG